MHQADAGDINNPTETASGMSPDNSGQVIAFIDHALKKQDERIYQLFELGSLLRTAALALDNMGDWHGVDPSVKRGLSDIWTLLYVAEERLEAVIGQLEEGNQCASKGVRSLRVA